MQEKNRWLMALCAVGIHISIGSVYAWSQIALALKQHLTVNWNLAQITLTFSIAIFFLGISAAFMGHFVERHGARVSGLLAAFLFGFGLVGAALAVKLESLWLLYLTYGVCCGVGMGIGYITPVSTLLKWFPDHRGLAMGVTIMGFGFGAALEVLLLQEILPLFGITSISAGLLTLGCIYFILMFCSALYLAPPPRDWLPAGFKIKLLTKKVRLNKDLAQLRANEAIKTPRFYYLWLMLFINVTCGLALISVAKFMARDVIHLDAEWAAIMVALMSVFNGLGRIGWATLSDYITRPITYIAFFVLQIIAFSLLTEVRNPAFFQILAYIIFACYGGGFAVLPAYIADVFGTKEVSAIHGYLLTAWAAAGLVGPSIIAGLRMLTGSYIDSLYVFVGFLIVALVISLMAKVNISRLKRQQSCT